MICTLKEVNPRDFHQNNRKNDCYGTSEINKISHHNLTDVEIFKNQKCAMIGQQLAQGHSREESFE
jgi:hypothetical protein